MDKATVAPWPSAGDGTASNRTVDERKGEHRGEEEQRCSGGREADGGRSALASSAGERYDGEGGVATESPPSVVGTGVSSAPDDSPVQIRQQTSDDKKESRWRMKMREDRSGRLTTVVGGGDSGR